jgi:hypothetical protein
MQSCSDTCPSSRRPVCTTVDNVEAHAALGVVTTRTFVADTAIADIPFSHRWQHVEHTSGVTVRAYATVYNPQLIGATHEPDIGVGTLTILVRNESAIPGKVSNPQGAKRKKAPIGGNEINFVGVRVP